MARTRKPLALPLALGIALASCAMPGCATAPPEPPPAEQARTPRGVLLPVIETYRLDNGMVIRDLRLGTGPPITLDDVMKAHVLGTFPESGEVFYSTIGTAEGTPDEPLVHPVRELIEGWQIGLPGTERVPGMRVGGIRTLYVPSQLAYGEEGRASEEDPEGGIPPRADLYFTIELLEINPAPTTDEPPADADGR